MLSSLSFTWFQQCFVYVYDDVLSIIRIITVLLSKLSTVQLKKLQMSPSITRLFHMSLSEVSLVCLTLQKDNDWFSYFTLQHRAMRCPTLWCDFVLLYNYRTTHGLSSLKKYAVFAAILKNLHKIKAPFHMRNQYLCIQSIKQVID